MATSKVNLDNILRGEYLSLIKDFLEERQEQVLITGSNEISVPVVDSEGNEKFVQILVKIPKGSRDGEEFDAFTCAEMYAEKVKTKEEKAKVDSEKKAKKIERDKKMREKRAEEKAKREAEKGE